MNTYSVGLDNIVVGETAISNVEGDSGRLSYRGHPIAELSQRPFMQVAWLLLFGEIPGAQQEQQLAHFLMDHRDLNNDERALITAVPRKTHPMSMLQGLVPLLDTNIKQHYDFPNNSEDTYTGLIIAAKIPTLISAYRNLELSGELPQSSRHIDPHRAFLQNLHQQEPNDLQVATLNAAQILQMEHSFNAGTFAGRVALSTAASIQTSISASIGTLYGKLHGGADQAALDTARMVGCPHKAEAYVAQCLDSGGRIMGMGHREYRTVDPRAVILKPMARKLCIDEDSANLMATLEAIEAACIKLLEKPDRQIRANVEFYKGAVFHALGIPSHYFTAMFAMARCFGYIAHCLEFRPQSRLIRPAAKYIGPV